MKIECVHASHGLSVSSVPRINLTRSHGSRGVFGSKVREGRRRGNRGRGGGEGGEEGEEERE